MPKSSKTIETDDLPESPLLDYTELIAVWGRQETVHVGGPPIGLSGYTFAKIAEGAIEQNPKAFRNGEKTVFRKRARALTEQVIAESCFAAGQWSEINNMHQQGVVSDQIFQDSLFTKAENEKTLTRIAAFRAAEIMQDILQKSKRRGRSQIPTGRPEGQGKADKLEALQDSSILAVAGELAKIQQIDQGLPPIVSKEDLSKMIPRVVRDRVATGQLRHLGDTPQDAITIHSKRLRATLDRTQIPTGGFVISWKSPILAD